MPGRQLKRAHRHCAIEWWHIQNIKIYFTQYHASTLAKFIERSSFSQLGKREASETYSQKFMVRESQQSSAMSKNALIIAQTVRTGEGL